LPCAQGTEVFADAGGQGADKGDYDTKAHWHLALIKPSELRRWKNWPRIGELLACGKQVKAATRTKVEHPLHKRRVSGKHLVRL
jgi:hypothetical protein